MIRILLISDDANSFSEFESGLGECDDVEISRLKSGKASLNLISEKALDLVVADEIIADGTGLEFAEKLVSVNPMTNCALVSSLTEKAFHEATEGMGILMKLPKNPDAQQAEMLIERLKKIISLS